MFCEPYRKVLSEAALRGEGLSRASEAHLAGCAACRAALADEQALGALIDGGLRTIASAETPASLVPRVRAEVVEVPATPVQGFRALGMATAVLAAAGVAVWLSETPRNRVEEAHPGIGAPAGPSSASSQLPARSVPHSEKSAATGKAVVPLVAPKHDEPLVLVSPEEQAGLERYLAASSRRGQNGSPQVAALLGDVKGIEPLEIAAMDVKAMTTEPLDSGGSK
jgi:hypothetical protein